MRDLSQLKVCFIAGTLGQGGAERQLFYTLKVLRNMGTDVRLLSLTSGEFWEQQIRDLGIQVTWVGQPASKLLRLRRMLEALRKQPPGVIQSQHFFTNLYAVGAGRALGLREIGAIRNDGKTETRVNGPVLGRLSLRAPRFIAANSRAGMNNAIEMGVPANRIHFLPNVVDCEQFKPQTRSENGVVKLIIAGRLVQQKRIDRFLSLFARLRQQNSLMLKAIVIGEGPLRSQLEQQALQMGLSPDAVQFRGAVADMRGVYHEADILVLTSDYEGTPNVLLEAMASGLPVVATDVGGVSEIVKHGETGYLARHQDEEAFAASLQKMVADRNLRMEFGDRAREHVVANHSVQRLPTYLEELYSATLP